MINVYKTEEQQFKINYINGSISFKGYFIDDTFVLTEVEYD